MNDKNIKNSETENAKSVRSPTGYYKTGLTLGYSPLTERIYLGKTKKNNPSEWVGKKEDITSDFIQVMLQKFDTNTVSNIIVNGKGEYRILVVDMTKEIKVNGEGI